MKKVLMYQLAFLIIILTSCSGEDSAPFKMQYIDLRTVIDATIQSNSSTIPTYQKEVWINDEQESLTTKEIDWSKELEVFYLVDLNKRDFLNKYSKDSSSNNLTYSLLPGSDASVKKLTVSFDSTGNIFEIAAFLSSDNFLYKSQRELFLRFSNLQLYEYRVEGWQELFIGSRKTYRMNATKKEG